MTYDFERLKLIMRAKRWTFGKLGFVLSTPCGHLVRVFARKARADRELMERVCGLLEVDIKEVEVTEFFA